MVLEIHVVVDVLRLSAVASPKPPNIIMAQPDITSRTGVVLSP